MLGGGKVQALRCVAVRPNGAPVQGGKTTTIAARHFVLAGGAINSPAVLMRSKVPDPHGLLGAHLPAPVVMSAAVLKQRVEGWAGAPQTVYTDHYMDTQPIDGPMGFKLEAPPCTRSSWPPPCRATGSRVPICWPSFPHPCAAGLAARRVPSRAPGGPCQTAQ